MAQNQDAIRENIDKCDYIEIKFCMMKNNQVQRQMTNWGLVKSQCKHNLRRTISSLVL